MTEAERTDVAEMDSDGKAANAIVVGVDGSGGAQYALEWAVAKTQLFGRVIPVLSYRVDSLGEGLGTPGMYADISRLLREGAESTLAEAIAPYPELSGKALLAQGSAGHTLVRAAADSDLLVVGNRGRSALAETILGSVGSYCVKHASVPVAVIPAKAKIQPTIDHIVVGIDGSKNSELALRWALDHVPSNGRIDAIGCWDLPDFGGSSFSAEAAKSGVAEMVKSTVTKVTDSAGGAEKVSNRVEFGDPRLVLRDAASAADLLVIGARGHRGVKHLILGSVTTSLLHHPTSPTVVVPAP